MSSGRRYWNFYLDELGFPEIQKPGPLALLAEADAQGLDELYETGLILRRQFFPALAEAESVAVHGLSRGIPRHFLENDAQYRTRTVKAWAWQRRAGRHWGLHKIFAEYGFPVIKLKNLTGAHWAEFDLIAESPPGRGLSEEEFELVYWLIFEYKRASAMLRTLRLAKSVKGRAVIKTALVAGEIVTLYPPPANPAEVKAQTGCGGLSYSHEYWILGGLN